MPVSPRPLALAREVQERYLGYLRTSFFFRDPELRRSFEDELGRGTLVKGPYIESTPVYERTANTQTVLRDLLGEPTDAAFLQALHPDRSLYAHQEQALRAIAEGRNVVVATGTGSGKTEAYLLPILAELYRQSLDSRAAPGVRALILYPMNALANDQRRRLGEIAEDLARRGSSFSFSFGRYTGETPEDERDGRRNAGQHIQGRYAGELVLRREMRERPPDILLTNYSMLEYMLLRPDDSPLFDNGRSLTWNFLVLDEAHLYRGAKGIEMAMLLRRLKERLEAGGLDHRLRCVATSASLRGGQDDRVGLACFAAELFDEPFGEGDILLEKRTSPRLEASLSIPPHMYLDLSKALDEGAGHASETVRVVAASVGLDVRGASDLAEQVHALIARDERAARLRTLLDQPRELVAAADEVFGDIPQERRVAALEALLHVVTFGRESGSEAPLLIVRYHLFLRALEGVRARFWPDKRVRLLGVAGDGVAPGPEERLSGAWLEVAVCRECGQHFFVGREEEGHLREAMRDVGSEDLAVAFFRPLSAGEDLTKGKGRRLCLECLAIARPKRGRDALPCGHEHSLAVEEEEGRAAADDQVRSCGACDYRGPDPVRELVHGTDGPNAVVATVLHRMLPEPRRKVLAFVDGRQEAAFFAWYLQRTYARLSERRLLYGTLRRFATDGYKAVSLRTLARSLRDLFRTTGVVESSADDLEAARRSWCAVYRELVSDEARISLEGVGLVVWAPELPSDLVLPRTLSQTPWSLSENEGRDLLRFLLDTLRGDNAVDLRTERGVSLSWDDLGLMSAQVGVAIGGRGRAKAWDGPKTRRVQFLTRVLAQGPGASLSPEARIECVQKLLREVWELFTEAGDATLLLRGGDAHRVNPDWWRAGTVDGSAGIHACDVCGRLQSLSIRRVCARYACRGTLASITAQDLRANHYREVYVVPHPPLLRAEEHTAQIEHELAREFQVDFERGKIHLLSCSTTFELGVDLGELDTIFLRNVPPEPFNYAQRVGRAGRRAGHPGFAVTYCRRRPHDLVHFQNPSVLMAGRAAPALLRVTNDKIASRHVTAVILSEFFRAHAERFDNVERLLADLRQSRFIADLRAFVGERRLGLQARLTRIVPPGLHGALGLVDGSWTDRVFDTKGPLMRADAEVSADYVRVVSLEESASKERRHLDANWAKRRAKTIAGEDVISFLSRKAVIPKYGFPVDVVELDLEAGPYKAQAGVSLQRDLSIAIAEFAPACEVIANKKVWTSVGLKRLADRAWPRRNYRRCARHGTFTSWDEGQDPPSEPCCDRSRPRVYVDPIFGFTTGREPPREPTRRPARVFSSRPYFVSATTDPPVVDMGGIASVRPAAPGRLVVLCEGRKGEGFSICPSCGAGAPGARLGREHESPWKNQCDTTPELVALGHEFITDVLRVRLHGPALSGAETGDLGPAQSLAYALLHGAQAVLEVPLQDVGVTVRPVEGSLAEIVLYDDVPGGAGLVARLESPPFFRQCLASARDRVAGACGCPEPESCYGCLRSYRNQFAHPYLARGPAHEYLDRLLARWKE